MSQHKSHISQYKFHMPLFKSNISQYLSLYSIIKQVHFINLQNALFSQRALQC